ncbi:histidine kinase [Halarcobacter ebronensis]|uniref:histidine kinase n=1 Tax=Halarcobacter ebronensis TaxID=1462615 RepID=A0A4Q0YEH0_9BACT|nr:sensor histidine kinase [Halarcobacter ebronensis]RXJ68917.1 histidine kinase [Halarcobacter ebronensis]
MKYILLSLFILVNLNATSIKNQIITNKLLSIDSLNYQKIDTYNLKKQKFNNVYIKIVLNKKLLENNTFYLRVFCDYDKILSSNQKYQSNFDSIVFKLDKNSPKEIEFNLNYKKESLLNIAFLRFSQFEYDYILKKESLLFGFAYGIIFCAFLYNFVIFIYTFQKSFLYYSLMQLFLMMILYYAVIIETQSYISLSQQIVTDFFETFCILLMILFSKEILNTKKTMKTLNQILNFLIYISIVDLITIFIFNYSLLYRFTPRSLIISILVVAGLIAIFKGQKVAIFYFIGWLVVLISLFISEYDLLGINELYIIHIGLPLESLILSFALGYKLKLSVDEKKQKDKMLIQQSKLASMGEMLNNIAHQWRQPLANLSFINLDLQMAIKNKDISINYLNEISEDSKKQINYMSDTLDNFKGFFQPNKKKEKFYISNAIKNATSIIKSSLEKQNIKLYINIHKDKEIYSYENELLQVILNILSNSKDALVQRNIKKPFIEITLNIVENKKAKIEIKDNAQGILPKYINKIFDPYFTTKHNNNGIGLYMSKIIVESHLNGDILVTNTNEGASFSIII